jgi:UDP-2,3-diacylglucosamine pyrophosphatase LpxH
MHVFVSDLHMTDTGSGGAVSDEQLAEFARHLAQMTDDKGSKIKLVFAGDIFDLLRSPKWAALWDEKKSAPWSGMSQKFIQFKKSFAETQAVEIAQSIATRYSGFSTQLKEAVKSRRIETVYLPGNHDYMFQLSPTLRRVLVDYLSLDHDPTREFQISYADSSASVFAVHGNSFDPVNWHRREEGYWALGDAVVLRVVNRFPDEVSKELGVAPETEIGQVVQEIDNVEPLADIPLYVLWLTENNLTIKSARRAVLKVWKRIVEEFLAISDFRDKGGYGAKQYQFVRYGFELSTQMGLADVVAELAKKFPNIGINYRAAAGSEARKHPQYRIVLFGHTHKPMLEALTYAPEGKNSFYVNTGCWRRLVARTYGDGATSFAGRRVATYFVVDEARDGERQERYHLFQQWHAS